MFREWKVVKNPKTRASISLLGGVHYINLAVVKAYFN
jgi:hypothetical protein